MVGFISLVRYGFTDIVSDCCSLGDLTSLLNSLTVVLNYQLEYPFLTKNSSSYSSNSQDNESQCQKSTNSMRNVRLLF